MTAAEVEDASPSGGSCLTLEGAYQKVRAKFLHHHPDGDAALLDKAFKVGKKMHAAQKRKSGEPYFFHPLAVAESLAEWRLDAVSLACAILHDTVEDTLMTMEEVRRQFGDEVGDIVDGLTKMSKLSFTDRTLLHAENVILENVAQGNQVEDALRWKTGFLEAQANTLIDGILVTDRQGRKLLQNRQLSSLFQVPQHIAEDEIDAKQVDWVATQMKNPEQFAEKVAYLYAHPSEASRDEVELKDGTILDRYTSPVMGPEGTYYGRLWTFRDITEGKRAAAALRASQRRQTEIAQELADHKQNEQRFRLALEREQKSSQMKSLFVRMASREFRTPLSVITMVAEMLDGDPDTLSDAERSEQLKEIQSAVGRMIQMMNDFPIHGSYTSRIWECKEGKGTTVWVHLPIAPPASRTES